MFRKLVFLFAFVLLSCGIVVRSQSGDETIKVDTRLVSVPVIVSDRNGRYIPDLTQNYFTIFQDGVPQRIEFFAVTEEPLTIALLIDTSQSARRVLGDIRDSARSLVKLLSPQDRAMIVSFDYDTHFLSPLTSDKEQLNNAIKKADIPDGRVGTTLRDAAYETIARTFRPIKGRKAVIILTDGKDAGSRIGEDELLNSLEESDTLVYTVMFKTDESNAFRPFPGRGRGGIFGGRFPQRPRGNPRRAERVERMNQNAEEFLREMSEVTAGRFFSSKDGKLKATFASIVEELRFQYRLGFYPPEENADAIFHEIKVKVSRAETVVRARNGYRLQSK